MGALFLWGVLVFAVVYGWFTWFYFSNAQVQEEEEAGSDVEWYREEVGEEPDEQFMRNIKAKKERQKVTCFPLILHWWTRPINKLARRLVIEFSSIQADSSQPCSWLNL